MSRVERIRVSSVNEPESEQPCLWALTLIICLHQQYKRVTRGMNELAFFVERRDAAGSLHTLERVCVSLMIADELRGLVFHVDELESARQLREMLLVEVVPELAAARQDLPGAAKVVRSILIAE